MEDYEPTDAEIDYYNETKEINCKFCKHSAIAEDSLIGNYRMCTYKAYSCFSQHPHNPDMRYDPVGIDEWFKRREMLV